VVEVSFESGPGAALAVDVGDQVTLTHPDLNPAAPPSATYLVTGYTRGPAGRFTLRLRALPTDMVAVNGLPRGQAQGVPPPNPPFQADEQIVPLPYIVSTVAPNVPHGVVLNHSLGRPPTVAVPLPPLPSGVTLVLSVFAATATDVTIIALSNVAVQFGGASAGWQFVDLLVI
jgi:hypothetical protein